MITYTTIQEFLKLQKVAIVGVSRDTKQFANIAYRLLRERKYIVYPVNPFAELIEGERCYSNIKSLPEKVDSVIIMLSPEKAMDVLKDIKDAEIKYVWIQQRSESEQVIKFCNDNDIRVIYGECIVMFLEPVSFPHRVHRLIKKISGRLPK